MATSAVCLIQELPGEAERGDKGRVSWAGGLGKAVVGLGGP